MNSTLTLTQEWDKTFPQNAAVDHCKVTFHNRFGIELAADLYKPKNAAGKRAAVAGSRAPACTRRSSPRADF